jgi:hypothetical protein
VEHDDELVQIAERQLAEAENAYRLDPSAANQRRIMNRWDAVRRLRGEPAELQELPPWWPARARPTVD